MSGKISQPSRWMAEALRLARRGLGSTSPNPAAGAVVVRSGAVVGRGYHRRAGEPHAEVLALDRAGEASRGATLYVTLEPCCHTGRTGPCTARIIESGVARVVASVQDPYPTVSGRGLRILRRAGIEVAVGDGAAEAKRINEAFFMRVQSGRPWVDVKLASTLDGKIADPSGVSQWITGAKARAEVHRLRWGSDAILVGINTILADDPRLTARRGSRRKQPLRVILDRALRTPRSAKVLTEGDPSRVLLVCHTDAPAARRRSLARSGAQIWAMRVWRGRNASLPPLLQRLAAEEISRVLVEGGGSVAGSFLSADLVDRLHLFLAPKALGKGTDLFSGLGPRSLEKAVALQIERVRRWDGDLQLSLGRVEASCSQD